MVMMTAFVLVLATYDRLATAKDSFLLRELPSSDDSRWWSVFILSTIRTLESLVTTRENSLSMLDPGSGTRIVVESERAARRDFRTRSAFEEYNASRSKISQESPAFATRPMTT
jgi:hypothetical protein